MTNVISSEGPTTEDKNKIRPLYYTLQGFLKEAPIGKDANEVLYSQSQWGHFNLIIDHLNTATGKNYDNFKIIQPTQNTTSKYVRVSALRGQLGGLINYLHGEYFYDEPAPLSGNPSMVFNQNLHQQQSQQQNMTVTLLEFQSKIDQRLANTTNVKEKSFLQKLKEQLPTIVSVGQLIQTILSLAHQTGLDPHTVSTLLA